MFKSILPLLILLPLCLSQTFYSTPSGSNIVNVCHCDLNKNFCDYYCCCDPDCSSIIINALKTNGLTCANNSLLTYCLEPEYFAFINVSPASTTQISPTTVCYDFNNTRNDQPEITLNTKKIQQIVNADQTVATGTAPNYYSGGYSPSVKILTTSKKLVETPGECSNINATGGPATDVYFGQDLSLSCGSTNCSAQNLSLFSEFSNKSLSVFYGQAQTITTPTISEYTKEGKCLSQATLLVFYSRLGVQAEPIYYLIDTRVTYIYSDSVTTYTMNVVFVDYDNLVSPGELSFSAPFFPMIPPDMFYPIIYTHRPFLLVSIGSLLLLLSTLL